MRHRPIHKITEDIMADWKNIDPCAQTYLIAMHQMNQVECFKTGVDINEGIVLHFLSNAQHWRGDTAVRIKKELKSILKTKNKNKVDVHKYAYERKDWDRKRNSIC